MTGRTRGGGKDGPAGYNAARKRRATVADVAIGQKLRALRLDKGMSQSDLGSMAGVTFQQLQKYDRGVTRISGQRDQGGFRFPWFLGGSLANFPTRYSLARMGNLFPIICMLARPERFELPTLRFEV